MLSRPLNQDTGLPESAGPGAIPKEGRDHAIAAAYDVFLASLNQSRSRLTQGRLKVARWLLGQQQAFSEAEVNRWLAYLGQPIGRRSVHNTLELLVESGLLLRIQHEDETIFIPLVPSENPEQSLIILCVHCLTTQEAPLPELPKIRSAIASRKGFSPRFSIHVLRAVCRTCREGSDPETAMRDLDS